MENVCGIHAVEMSGVLGSKNIQHYLIIDCRSFLSFNLGRIVESINIHCPPILKRRSGGFISLENLVPCEHKRSLLLSGVITNVLVYDDNTENLSQVSNDSNLFSVIKSLLQQINNVTVRFIIGGFEAMREECPALCVEQIMTHNNRDRQGRESSNRQGCSSLAATSIFKEPAEILPYLYLGDESHSSQQSILERLGITALVNVSSSCNNHFEDRYRYMNIHIDDSMNADLFSWFSGIIKFIDDVAAENGKVLVHCWAGISRSATVCIAYIMQMQRLSLESAFDFVLSRRPVIDPNLNFIQQLQRFEKHCIQRQCPQITHIPPPSPSPRPNSVFSFSPVSPMQPSTSNFLSQNSMVPYSSHTNRTSSSSSSSNRDPGSSIIISSSEKQELSPSSLSQTAASPNPIRVAPSRPKSLPILQLNACVPLHHQYSISPTGMTLASSQHQQQGIEESFTPSLMVSQAQKLSPMFEFSHDPEDEFAGAIPVSQDPGFDIFPQGSSACPSASLPSSAHHHPTGSTSMSSYLSAGGETSFPSPLSPHSVPLSPLSPLPSFG